MVKVVDVTANSARVPGDYEATGAVCSQALWQLVAMVRDTMAILSKKKKKMNK